MVDNKFLSKAKTRCDQLNIDARQAIISVYEYAASSGTGVRHQYYALQ